MDAHLNNNNTDASIRARRKRETRDTIMRCAYHHFQVHGYKEARLEDIAACAGISKRTVLRYFPSKEDIAVAFAEDSFDAFASAAANRPPGIGIIDYWRAFMLRITSNISRGGVLVKHALLVAENPSLYGRRLHIRRRYVKLIAAELSAEAGVSARSDIYASMFALMLVNSPHDIVDELVIEGRLGDIVEHAMNAIDRVVANFPARPNFKCSKPDYAPVDPALFNIPPVYDPPERGA